MSLLWELARTVVISAALMFVLVVFEIGPRRFLDALADWRPRMLEVLPYLVVLVGILMIRLVGQPYFEGITRALDINITVWIFATEGDLVTHLQAVATPSLTTFFGFMYIYGYIVLVAFPALAYFCLPRMGHLKELLAAFAVNYAVGLTFYVVFLAYGPRNLGWDFTTQWLYDIYPESAMITGMVNIPINVFPSLHASLAVTAFLLAWRTRRIYPLWALVAGVYAVAVVVSTMYLGIHWITDVVAGILLAVLAVYVAVYVVDGRPVLGRFTSEPRSPVGGA